MFKKLLFLPLVCAASFVNAQNFDWAAQFSGNNYAQNLAVTTDNDGNVFTTGYFSGIVDFDPGVGTSNLSAAGGDIFVSKLDASGALVWVKQIGSIGDEIGWAIATDNSSNVYVTGSFLGTVDFDPGAGTASVASVNANDVFVLKLAGNGDFDWVKTFGSMDNEEGNCIKVDASENVYISGIFNNGPIDMDPGAGTFNLSGFYDTFILKLDVNGDFVWAKKFTNPIDIVHIYGFEFDDSGNIYTTGRFNDITNFDTGAGTTELTPVGAADIFVCKLDASGDLVWVKQISGSDYEEAYGIDLDATNNIYITGYFGGTVDFDPGAATENLTSEGDDDIFVCKLNPAGEFVWAEKFGSGNADRAEDLVINSIGNIYIGGAFGGVVDFDPTAGTNILTAGGLYDGFCLKLNSDGTVLSAMQIGGSETDWIQSLAIDPTNNVFMTGWFGGTADLDPTATTANFTTVGSMDGFVVKLAMDDAGISDNNQSYLTLYPNPATTQITVQTGENIEAILIYNLLGELVHSSTTKTISIENLENGVYVVAIKTVNGINKISFVKQ
jgi:hypothetical protein